MSRGFVKEDDLEQISSILPEKPVSIHPNYVTEFGLKQLQGREYALLEARRKIDFNVALSMQNIAVIDRELRYRHD